MHRKDTQETSCRVNINQHLPKSTLALIIPHIHNWLEFPKLLGSGRRGIRRGRALEETSLVLKKWHMYFSKDN